MGVLLILHGKKERKKEALNVRLCSLIYQRCSGSSTKCFLCPALCNPGAAVTVATKHEVCFGAHATVGERRHSQCLHSHTQHRAFCLENAPMPLFILLPPGFIVPVGQGERIPLRLSSLLAQNEEIRPRLQCNAHLAFLACSVIIRPFFSAALDSDQ